MLPGRKEAAASASDEAPQKARPELVLDPSGVFKERPAWYLIGGPSLSGLTLHGEQKNQVLANKVGISH